MVMVRETSSSIFLFKNPNPKKGEKKRFDMISAENRTCNARWVDLPTFAADETGMLDMWQ